MNIAVSGSDLEKIGGDSIPIPGAPDKYIAGLGVFHELHCLVREAFLDETCISNMANRKG
jgi:hypothetical protein